MKILLYNWVQFDDPKRRGGGVTVYLADLLKQVCTSKDWECYFLSSGLEYTFDGRLRIEQTINELGNKVKSFAIVNSPIHAPASVQFSGIDKFGSDKSLYSLIDSFLTENGPFDVIHFHNLEGISLSVLKLKERYPETKFVYSMHNYFAFCPQVNLWAPEGNCYLQSCFPNCSNCVISGSGKTEQFIGSLKSYLKLNTSKDRRIVRFLKRMADCVRSMSVEREKHVTSSVVNDTVYQDYRRENVLAINDYIDTVLAVSGRVSQIAEAYGILPSKLIVSYIGTKAAMHRLPPKRASGDVLRIGYLGYARKDKGFDFLLQALDNVPVDMASRIVLVLAAKCETEGELSNYSALIKPLRARFKSITFSNGFTKDNQRLLLDQIDLGVVPSLWEDNLPQIAIEYVANGVPILTSDVGGTCELCTNPTFVYQSTDVVALKNSITYFAEKPERVNQFWNTCPVLMPMEKHIEELEKIYTMGKSYTTDG